VAALSIFRLVSAIVLAVAGTHLCILGFFGDRVFNPFIAIGPVVLVLGAWFDGQYVSASSRPPLTMLGALVLGIGVVGAVLRGVEGFLAALVGALLIAAGTWLIPPRRRGGSDDDEPGV